MGRPGLLINGLKGIYAIMCQGRRVHGCVGWTWVSIVIILCTLYGYNALYFFDLEISENRVPLAQD